MKNSIVSEIVDYRNIYESIPGLTVIVNTEFTILNVSNDYKKSINTSENKLIGKNIFSILRTENNINSENYILQLTDSFNKVIKSKTSDIITIQWNYNFLTNENNKSESVWKISNHPILSDTYEVIQIIHQIEEISSAEIIKASISLSEEAITKSLDLETEELLKSPETDYEIKILLVDDRDDNLFSLKEILSRDGYTFRTARSGLEALKVLLHELDFTLIIMDVKMPGLNGIETASLIYEREKLRHIPIIFITAGEHSESSLFLGYKTGAVDYIYKPINPNILRAKVAVFAELFKKNHLLTAHKDRLGKAASLLKIKNKLLANNNSELEAFTYSVSHDLKAPLRAIEGYSVMLEEDYSDKLEDKGLESLHEIIKNSKKMGHLIVDLLHLSKVSRKELNKNYINIEAIISGILIEQSNQIEKRGITFQIQSIESAMADENLLKQVWINLISNAIKYTQYTSNASIEIGSQKGEYETTYFIKDNGVGFDMKYADKLFNVFQRLHSENEFEGTGVGLAIVKRIIQKHGGKIWANSQVNHGTTFYFTLPNK